MAKLKGSECEMILKLAGDVIGDKGFIGTDYIITPVRKPEDRDLYMREHDYNNQISSLRARRASRRQPKDMADSLHGLQKTAEDLLVLVPGRYRLILLRGVLHNPQGLEIRPLPHKELNLR
jgi:hypothetical protein